MSVGIARKLQEAYPDEQLVEPAQTSGKVKVTDGRVHAVTEKLRPMRLSSRTNWGPVSLDPSFCIRCHSWGR